MLRSTGLPVVYRNWPKGCDPEYPCIAYRFDTIDTIWADNGPYMSFGVWGIELYSEGKDEAAEAAVEKALAEHGVCYSKAEYDIEDEYIEVEYTFSSIVDTEKEEQYGNHQQ